MWENRPHGNGHSCLTLVLLEDIQSSFLVSFFFLSPKSLTWSRLTDEKERERKKREKVEESLVSHISGLLPFSPSNCDWIQFTLFPFFFLSICSLSLALVNQRMCSDNSCMGRKRRLKLKYERWSSHKPLIESMRKMYTKGKVSWSEQDKWFSLVSSSSSSSSCLSLFFLLLLYTLQS